MCFFKALIPILYNQSLLWQTSERHFESKKIYGPFFNGWDSAVSRLQCHYKENVYFSPLSPQKVLVLIWSTSDRWKAEWTSEQPSCFEPGSPRLGIQRPNHCSIELANPDLKIVRVNQSRLNLLVLFIITKTNNRYN